MRRSSGSPPAGSLVSLGTEALTSERARAEFHPAGYRSLFIAAATVLLGTAEILALAGLDWVTHAHRRAGVVALAEAALMIAAVVAVLRMRAWGIFAALLASASAGFIAVLASIPHARGVLQEVMGSSMAYDIQPIRTLFGVNAVLALLVASPIAVSWIRPVRHDATERLRAWQWLHGALLGVAILIASVGFVS